MRNLDAGLHNASGSYWCPDCHAFTFDCTHLVEPLTTPRMILNNWQIQSVAYDRARQILEMEMNTLERFQFYRVPRYLAVEFVKADDQAQFHRDNMNGKFVFARVKLREILTGCR